MPAIDSNWAMMMVLIGLGGLASIAANIVLLINSARRKPPIDQELINYVRHPDLLRVEASLKSDIQSMDDRHNKAAAEQFAVIRQLQIQVDKTFQDLCLMIGNLNGEIKSLHHDRRQ